MAVKIADTLKAMSNTFPVAECVDIDVNINGTTKRLQKAIDDGEIGGGSDSTWKGTHEEWEALSTEEKGKYEVICFTDDYDESGICGSDSTWKGTHEEWEALPTEEKEKYEIVYFTDDYDAADSTGSIDDTNASVNTTYSSSKIENSLSNKANTTDLTVHTNDTNIHVTTSDKTKWNNSVNKTDIVDNLTSTNTDKPLSANQGKVLKDDIVLKANATDLTSHTGDTNIHITTAERTKWNKVDNKVDKTDIIDNLTSTNTDKPLSAKQGKVLKDEIYNKSKNKITPLSKGADIMAYADSIGDKFVTDTVKLRDTTSSPYGVGNNNNDFYYTIYNTDDYKFKRIIAYDIRKNDMYMLIKSGGTWGTWQRLCATSVADVGTTTINPTFPSTVTLGKINITRYSIKNGWANVTIIMNLIASPKFDWTSITTELPKPDKEVHVAYCGETGINNTNVAFRLKVNGSLDMLVSSEITKSDWWNLSFSYPVAEE